jgi:putative glutamine amidotransferase
MLAVCLGGDLQPLGHRRHDQRHAATKPHHFIKIKKRSRVGRACKRQRLKVNSLHRFHVVEVPSGFTVSARATDGVIEAMEYDADGRWIVGVQFHPERLQQTRPAFRQLFRAFLRAR